MSTSSSDRQDALPMQRATVRYQVKDVDLSITFYTKLLAFELEQKTGPFAAVVSGTLRLILSGPGTSGARSMPSGQRQEPGGWNRIVLYVADLASEISRLTSCGAHFRGQVEVGPGGSQILLEDPDGNLIELHESHAQGTRP